MVSERVVPEVGFGEAEVLDTGAHRAIEDEDAVGEVFMKLSDPSGAAHGVLISAVVAGGSKMPAAS